MNSVYQVFTTSGYHHYPTQLSISLRQLHRDAWAESPYDCDRFTRHSKSASNFARKRSWGVEEYLWRHVTYCTAVIHRFGRRAIELRAPKIRNLDMQVVINENIGLFSVASVIHVSPNIVV